MPQIRRHGAEAVNSACQRALEAEAINVGLIDRMLTRVGDHTPPPTSDPPRVVRAAGRFVRDSAEFTVRRPS